MKIPNSKRKKALIVDVQPRFLNDRMAYIVERINKLITDVPYSLYFEALFHAEEDSMWNKQAKWFSSKDNNMLTATAHEASDFGFFTYIIEECCQATRSEELHNRAIANLRQTKLTNNSCVEEIPFIEVVLSKI